MADEIELFNDSIKEIQALFRGLKKHNSDRRYAPDYVDRKKSKLSALHNTFKQLFNQLLPTIKPDRISAFKVKGDDVEVTVSEILTILNAIQKKIDATRDTIASQSEGSTNQSETEENQDQFLLAVEDQEFKEEESQKEFKMASFDIKTASNIIPDFSGESDKVLDFLSAVKFYSDTLNEVGKTLLINFVLNIKIKGKAKNGISYTNIQNYTELHKAISERFEIRKTVATLTQELALTKQGNSSVSEYAEKIDKIIFELSRVQILNQNGENADLIRSLNDTTAANAFKNGLKNELKTIVLASRATTFAEVVSIAHESEAAFPKNTSQVNYVESNGQRGHNNRGNKKQSGRYNQGRGSGQSRGRGRGSNNNQNGHNNNNRNYRGSSNSNRGYSHRGGRNRGNFRGHGNSNGNAYYNNHRVCALNETQAGSHATQIQCSHGCWHQTGNAVAPGPARQQPGAACPNHIFTQ